MIGGLEPFNEGSIIIDGIDISNKRNHLKFFGEKVGFLFQNFALIENKTVRENLEMVKKSNRTNTSIEDALKSVGLLEKIDNKSPVLYDTYDKSLRDLEIGRIDAICGDEVLLKYYVNQKDKNIYNILDENLGTEDYVVAVKKDNTELRDKINSTLKKMKEDKSFNEIYSKWF